MPRTYDSYAKIVNEVSRYDVFGSHRQLELARCHYNFIRRHIGLRFGRELRTPAMVTGLRNRVCSFRDVFAFA